MTKYFFIGILFFSTACATGFRKVDPATSVLYNTQIIDSVEVGFDANHFKTYAKSRYVKKAGRKNITLIAVKIVNSKTDTLLPIRDIKFLVNGEKINSVSPRQVQKEIKQPELIHFAWYLLALPFPAVIDAVGPFTQIPVALVTGNYNLFRAGAANRHLIENLKRDDILYRPIPPGETSYGLISIRHSSPIDFGFELKSP